MSLADSIKKKFSAYFLGKETGQATREKVACSIDQAKTVGIVFQYTTAEDFELVKKYVLYLRELKKKVHAIGLYTMKELPSFPYSKLEFDFFSKKQFSWYGKPSEAVLKNFVDEKHDILLDFNLQDAPQLNYLVALSRAKFKVGRWRENDQDIHDLLIDSPADKGLKNLMRHIDTYLGKINSPEAP